MEAGPFKTEEYTSILTKADLEPAVRMREQVEKNAKVEKEE